jgi:hypothetical protein
MVVLLSMGLDPAACDQLSRECDLYTQFNGAWIRLSEFLDTQANLIREREFVTSRLWFVARHTSQKSIVQERTSSESLISSDGQKESSFDQPRVSNEEVKCTRPPSDS